MRISNKNKRKLLETVDDAFLANIKDYYPDILDNPPEVWNDEERDYFDRVSELITKIQNAMEIVFAS